MPRTFQYQKLAEPPVIVEAAEPEAAPPLDWLAPSVMPAAWGQPRDAGAFAWHTDTPASAVATPFDWLAQQPQPDRLARRGDGYFAEPPYQAPAAETPFDWLAQHAQPKRPAIYTELWRCVTPPVEIAAEEETAFDWNIQRAERPRDARPRQPGLFTVDPTTPVAAAPEVGDATGLMDWLTASVMPAAFGQPRDSGVFAWHTETPADVGGGNRRRRLLIASA
jgi:hypothetical protein